jgi:hypothetical protein
VRLGQRLGNATGAPIGAPVVVPARDWVGLRPPAQGVVRRLAGTSAPRLARVAPWNGPPGLPVPAAGRAGLPATGASSHARMQLSRRPPPRSAPLSSASGGAESRVERRGSESGEVPRHCGTDAVPSTVSEVWPRGLRHASPKRASDSQQFTPRVRIPPPPQQHRRPRSRLRGLLLLAPMVATSGGVPSRK